MVSTSGLQIYTDIYFFLRFFRLLFSLAWLSSSVFGLLHSLHVIRSPGRRPWLTMIDGQTDVLIENKYLSFIERGYGGKKVGTYGKEMWIVEKEIWTMIRRGCHNIVRNGIFANFDWILWIHQGQHSTDTAIAIYIEQFESHSQGKGRTRSGCRRKKKWKESKWTKSLEICRE